MRRITKSSFCAWFMCLWCANGFSQTSIDYSDVSHWHAHPSIVDASDRSLPWDEIPFVNVDVFYIHPTTYFKGINKNSSIHKRSLDKKAQLLLLNQASVFSGTTNIYAPKYRQIRQHVLIHSKEEKKKKCLDIAYQDVRSAFMEYMTLWNNDKPIIIASHGQGSLHAQRLLSEFFDSLYFDKLVVAYMPGYPMPEIVDSTNFSRLSVCQSDSDLHCYNVWETVGKSYTAREKYEHHFWIGNNYQLIESGEYKMVSPLNWQIPSDEIIEKNDVVALRPSNNYRIPLRTVTYDAMAYAKNRKLYLKGENKLLFNSTGQNYYRYDYNLFYGSIRDNVVLKIARYNEKIKP